MKVCSICGMEYQWVTGEHNLIHAQRQLKELLDLGENASPEDVERFRRYWARVTQ